MLETARFTSRAKPPKSLTCILGFLNWGCRANLRDDKASIKRKKMEMWYIVLYLRIIDALKNV